MQNFNYHQHTFRCGHADMDVQDEDYVKEYIKMGFKKIAFTDHAPEKNVIDTRQNMRMPYSKKNEYLNSIKNLKEKYKDKIEIETGFEVEYLPGEEENILELKSDVDKIILGQHFVYDNNRNLRIIGKVDLTDEELIRYAEYVEKAIELGIPNIIAHPDFFMYRRENFGEVEEKVTKRICEAAERKNIILEINLSRVFAKTYYENKELNNDSFEKQREKLKKFERIDYPCKEFWQIASNYNINVLYGIDVHHKKQISIYKELIKLVNEFLGEEIISKLKFI